MKPSRLPSYRASRLKPQMAPAPACSTASFGLHVSQVSPLLGASFQETLSKKPPHELQASIIRNSTSIEKSMLEVKSTDTIPEMRKKMEKNAATVQHLNRVKQLEKKRALEAIRRRQEEAKYKHETARANAALIAEVKTQMRAMFADVRLEDVLALVREENRDIQEAIELVSGNRLTGTSLDVIMPVQTAAKAKGRKRAEKKTLLKSVPSRETLEPETVSKALLAIELPTQPQKIAPSDLTQPVQKVTPSIEEQQIPAHLLIDTSAVRFLEEATRALLDESGQLDEILLFDESTLSKMDERLAEAEMLKALKRAHAGIMKRKETWVQLRGTCKPLWFNGYMSVTPHSPTVVQMRNSPSLCLRDAWLHLQPDEHKNATHIVT